MGLIADTQKELIRQRVPLEEILPDYNVQLIASGRKFKALCPFHREKTPSFWVDPDKQLYHCYGCQEGGDLFRFVQTMDGVGWKEALRLLAQRAGVVLEEVQVRSSDFGLVELFDANRLAADFYHRLLLEDPRAEHARQYLTQRRIDPSMWKQFQIGYSLPDWDGFLQVARAKNIQTTILEKAGLIRARRGGDGHYDYFRGRLLFPIGDAQGRVLGFGGRTLGDDEPKYLNTPKTAIFDKSQVLYGIQQAKVGIRRDGFVSIVEGYTDVIAAHQAGLETFVASLGTAFTEENAKQLHRLAPRVQMIFDGDAAGQKALERSLDLLVAESLDVQIYTVTDGKDPCDAVLALGGDGFRARVEQESQGIFEFKWRVSVDQLGADASPTERGRGIDECLMLVAKVPNSITRQLILRQLSERARVSEQELQARWRELAKKADRLAPRKIEESGADGASQGAAENRVFEPLSELAETVLNCLLAQPTQASTRWQQVPRELFNGDFGREVVALLELGFQEGSFSAEDLVRRSESPHVSGLIARLSCVRETEGDEDSSADDDESWELCLRDLSRWQIRSRIAELDRLIQLAQQERDDERVLVLQRERMELRKQSKRRQVGLGA